MSGGEKARLVLAMMVWQRPNLLLLDEPTNHLDLTTREALAVALNEFEGTLMLVSHDRALLRSVCDEFWLVGRGGIAPFDGDLDDYQRYLLEEAKRLRELVKEESRTAASQAADFQQVSANLIATSTANTAGTAFSASENSPTNAEQRKLDAQRRQQQAQRNKPLQRELAEIDTQMAKLGAEKAQLEAALQGPTDADSIAQMGKRLKAIQKEVDSLEERWLALTEQLEMETGTP
jgi:ATP-binding cassette subfamily F protein 3